VKGTQCKGSSFFLLKMTDSSKHASNMFVFVKYVLHKICKEPSFSTSKFGQLAHSDTNKCKYAIFIQLHVMTLVALIVGGGGGARHGHVNLCVILRGHGIIKFEKPCDTVWNNMFISLILVNKFV
jgi:hypothetical protein